MGKRRGERQDLLPGTLDMLILKSLTRGVMHGYGIAEHIRQLSDEVLQVEEGSLYPALQRLQITGVDRLGMGPLGEQPPRPLLPADRGRAQAAGRGGDELRSPDRRDYTSHEAGDVSRLHPSKNKGTPGMSDPGFAGSSH